MRLKHFIISTMLATLSWTECLADGVRFLVVNGKDGSKTTFALSDNPKVSCKSGELTVIAGSRTFILGLADVQNYLFEEEFTGIENVMQDGSVKMENGCVVFSGLNAESAVSVYLQDGRLIKESKTDAGGNAIVEMSNLPKGILIIHSNKTDIKIINR